MNHARIKKDERRQTDKTKNSNRQKMGTINSLLLLMMSETHENVKNLMYLCIVQLFGIHSFNK